MEPYRKPIRGDALLPLHAVYQAQRSPQNELPDHVHDIHELVYVHRGRGTIFIDHTFFEQRPGDLFVIPGNTIHRAFPDADDAIVSTAVFFAPALVASDVPDDAYSHLELFESARKERNYKIVLPEPARRDVEERLRQIHLELSGGETGSREAVRLHLRLLLLSVNRHLSKERHDRHPGVSVGPLWIRQALRRIDREPELRLGLAELADAAKVSAPHFSRVFKRLTGMTVTEYMNAKRIIRAKRLLAESDETIARIAERCGFESLPHFHRMFKSISGFTPNEYRKERRSHSS